MPLQIQALVRIKTEPNVNFHCQLFDSLTIERHIKKGMLKYQSLNNRYRNTGKVLLNENPPKKGKKKSGCIKELTHAKYKLQGLYKIGTME